MCVHAGTGYCLNEHDARIAFSISACSKDEAACKETCTTRAGTSTCTGFVYDRGSDCPTTNAGSNCHMLTEGIYRAAGSGRFSPQRKMTCFTIKGSRVAFATPAIAAGAQDYITIGMSRSSARPARAPTRTHPRAYSAQYSHTHRTHPTCRHAATRPRPCGRAFCRACPISPDQSRSLQPTMLRCAFCTDFHCAVPCASCNPLLSHTMRAGTHMEQSRSACTVCI